MEELIEQAKKGNEEAFTKLIISLKTMLYSIAKARLKNEEDRNDAMQETMLIAFQSIKKLKHHQYFKTWITKILINECNKIYKSRKKVSYEEIENVKNDIHSNIEISEERLDFNFICKELKYEDRMIIILYYMQKFTDKEIAQILKLKENTVKTKRTRAKNQIKNILKGGKQDG